MSQMAQIMNMRTALYRHYSADGRLLYVGISLSPMARTAQHAGSAAWFDNVARIEIEWHDNRKDALIAERNAIAADKPSCNVVVAGAGNIVTDASLAARLLGEHMASNGLSAAHLAAQAGVTRQYIWALAKGTSLPRVDVAFRIEDATGGAVPARAWVE